MMNIEINNGINISKKYRILTLVLTAIMLFAMVPMTVGHAATQYGVVNVESVLNVRSGAGTNYEILGQLEPGVTVTITGTSGSWYAIQYGSGTGYVSADYIILTSDSGDSAFEAKLTAQQFPESYKPALRVLHAKYPNWEFTSLQTGLEWTDALNAENKLGVNLVSSGADSSWKGTQSGAFDWTTDSWVVFDSGGWVQASKEIIAYYMDPRNLMTEDAVFQFLNQSYDASSQTVAGVTSMVSGTFLANTVTDADGNTLKYPEALFTAGSTYGVSPYVLASMILEEQGTSGGGACISGEVTGYEGYYNFYNIGAYATSSMTAVQRGMWYAKGGNDGATSYNRPWNTRYKAILGGAEFYYDNYLSEGQNTLYLKKFNVQGSSPYTGQYMTNVQGADTEGRLLADAYTETMREATLSFSIPVYNNMPSSAATMPVGTGSPNYKLKSLGITGKTLTPDFNTDTTSYSLVVENSVTSVTVTAAAYSSSATVSGTGTKTLAVGNNTINVVVTAGNGTKRTYVINVSRKAGTGDFSYTTSYTVASDIATGVEPGTTVSDFIANLHIANGSAAVYTSAGKAKADTDSVGTGDKVTLYNGAGTQQQAWTVVIYGDVNGDGAISNSDRIKVRNHILGSATLSGNYLKAADVNKDNTVSNADRIKIRNSVLGTFVITQ